MKELKHLFDAHKKQAIKLRSSKAKDRLKSLKKLKKMLQSNRKAIQDALFTDLGRNASESDLIEIAPTLHELDFAINHVDEWMSPKPVGSSVSTLTGSSEIRYEPKGTSLIISPWNYPLYLSIGPLIAAISAGCPVILKPSEYSVATSTLLEKLIASTFSSDEIVVINGEADTAQALLDLPFDHIFFTGSTAIGKIVMEKAAKHLSSVTLELGGKSPTVVDKSANIKTAAQKIAWGKSINSGQTCIAPDYILVHKEVEDSFINELKKALLELYPEGVNSNDYGKIISEKHFNRLKSWYKAAVDKGAHEERPLEDLESGQKLFPSVLKNVPESCSIMQEEIFGPILPIVSYSNLNEAVEYINERDKPLALYVFAQHSKTIETIIEKTSSGGVCVNDVVLHISNPHLPFGGVNTSGHGSYHGFYGFKAFSHEKSIFKQNRWINITSSVSAPYKKSAPFIKLIEKMS